MFILSVVVITIQYLKPTSISETGCTPVSKVAILSHQSRMGAGPSRRDYELDISRTDGRVGELQRHLAHVEGGVIQSNAAVAQVKALAENTAKAMQTLQGQLHTEIRSVADGAAKAVGSLQDQLHTRITSLAEYAVQEVGKLHAQLQSDIKSVADDAVKSVGKLQHEVYSTSMRTIQLEHTVQMFMLAVGAVFLMIVVVSLVVAYMNGREHKMRSLLMRELRL